MHNCAKAAGFKQHHQGRAEGQRMIALWEEAAGSKCLLHPAPALPAASPDSTPLQQQRFMTLQDALLKTQPAHSRNCLERSLPPAMPRDGAPGRRDLAGGSVLLGLKLSVCKQLSPGSCWVQLDESG